jgi:uncharacterized membrane protein
MTTWDRRVEAGVVRGALALARHWLPALNALLAVFVTLPLLAPLLMAYGYTQPAGLIYAFYRITCHQEPQRSYFLAGPRVTYSRDEIEAATNLRPLSAYLGSPEMGYKAAYCERDTAMYMVMLLAGLAFSVMRRRLPRLPPLLYALLLVPLAVDGLTQLAGWRESTWLLRSVTGGLFGLANVWLLYPELDVALERAAGQLEAR